MRLSEFRRAVDDEFGPTYGAVLVHDLVLRELDGRTAQDALAAGVPAGEVWAALCAAKEVPEARRRGAGRPAPKA